MKRAWAVLVVGVVWAIALESRAATPIPVMLLDGESGGAYHDWPHVTPVLKKILDETGLFAVTVVTAPATSGELATAYSDPSNAGTGRHEPQLMVIRYGDGRIFHTTLGHDISALISVDFVVTLHRGTEWAATGEVTQKVPATFPTADAVSYRADLAAMEGQSAK